MVTLTASDFESYNPTDSIDATTTMNYTPVEDPYAGLNRAQRRKAMAVEWRALKKRIKRGGR